MRELNEVIPSIEFKVDVLEYNDLNTMKKQITESLNSHNTYIIFPILPCKILRNNKRSKMDIAHWIVLEKGNLFYTSGVYSQKTKLVQKSDYLDIRNYSKGINFLNEVLIGRGIMP